MIKKPFSVIKNLIQAKTFFKKLPWVLGRRAFFVIIVFSFLSVLFGVFLFYVYVVGPSSKEPEVFESPVRFRQDLYYKILNQWEIDSQKESDASKIERLNPFNKN